MHIRIRLAAALCALLCLLPLCGCRRADSGAGVCLRHAGGVYEPELWMVYSYSGGLAADATRIQPDQAADDLTAGMWVELPVTFEYGSNLRKVDYTLYRVDENGDIEMPVLGKLHVAGLVRTEAEELIKAALEKQVVNPMVQVNLVNARVAVLGEVTRPGTISISHGRLTVLEALSAAGDLTPYGRRDNVLISREVDGKMEFARLDLTREDLITSPYYFLQQNDVIYVSPNAVRAINSANVSLWLSMVSTVASAATVIVTVVSIAK